MKQLSTQKAQPPKLPRPQQSHIDKLKLILDEARAVDTVHWTHEIVLAFLADAQTFIEGGEWERALERAKKAEWNEAKYTNRTLAEGYHTLLKKLKAKYEKHGENNEQAKESLRDELTTRRESKVSPADLQQGESPALAAGDHGGLVGDTEDGRDGSPPYMASVLGASEVTPGVDADGLDLLEKVSGQVPERTGTEHPEATTEDLERAGANEQRSPSKRQSTIRPLEGSRYLNKSEHKKIKTMIGEGWGQCAIAKEIGCPNSTFSEAIRDRKRLSEGYLERLTALDVNKKPPVKKWQIQEQCDDEEAPSPIVETAPVETLSSATMKEGGGDGKNPTSAPSPAFISPTQAELAAMGVEPMRYLSAEERAQDLVEWRQRLEEYNANKERNQE